MGGKLSQYFLHDPEFLSLEAIEGSREISEWLKQFSNTDQITAKMLLSKLRFISRDSYSQWLTNSISRLPKNTTYAFYSVRKLAPKQTALWDEKGVVASRPGVSQGSEDLVYSLIANFARAQKKSILDHPSINEILRKKIHSFVLIDDSIGSGKRISGFINKMLQHPTFKSWWSYGLINITVLSYMRFGRSEKNIMQKINGSNLGSLKFPKASKIKFISHLAYWETAPTSMWGDRYPDIRNMCANVKQLPENRRLGFDDVMSNTIFHHSVPNNTPGALWFENDEWQPLFPGRSLPGWLPPLLDVPSKTADFKGISPSPELIRLLKCIQSGIRSIERLSDVLCCDYQFADLLLDKALSLKLISEKYRITLFGRNLLLKAEKEQKALPIWKEDMYIPTGWCTD
ncbi:hypothetical protein ACM9HO_02410 [Pseudomonas sp. KHB2.9]